MLFFFFFFFSSRRRHTRCGRDWSSDVCSSDLLLRRQLEEALEPGARMLGPVALIAMRQEERQARGLSPLGQPGSDELVDDDLRAVDEVAELRFPEDERLRRCGRVAVLEADAGVLRER